MLNEFYRVTFRKKLYRTLEELQTDFDRGIEASNRRRSHQGCWYYGKAPIQPFIDSVPLAKGTILPA